MDKEIVYSGNMEAIHSIINTVGWWLVHIVAAHAAPEEAMRAASEVMPHPLHDIEDLDDDTDED